MPAYLAQHHACLVRAMTWHSTARTTPHLPKVHLDKALVPVCLDS